MAGGLFGDKAKDKITDIAKETPAFQIAKKLKSTSPAYQAYRQLK